MRTHLNTTAQGDAFEKRVYDILQEMLEQNIFPANCQCSRIFHKHKLCSRETNKEIIFDIVIETFMPGSDYLSMIYVIECKDYKRPVGVERIRNLAHQMEEVGAHKGFIFSTSGFQSSTYDIAKTRHIGLIRVAENNAVDWILYKTEHNKRHHIKADIKNYILGDSQSEQYNFAAISGSAVYNDIVSFVETEMQVTIQRKRAVKYLSEEEIISSIYKYTLLERETHDKVTNEQLLSIVADLGFTYEQTKNTSGIAGNINFKNKKVIVSDGILETTPHWRFTIAHEIGHIILHSIVLKLSNITELSESSHENNWGTQFSPKDIERIEFQANLLAVALLIPKEKFNKVYAQYHIIHKLRLFPKLYLDNQPCNIQICDDVFCYLSNYFDVSIECIRNYLVKANLLTINNKILPVCDFFRRTISY